MAKEKVENSVRIVNSYILNNKGTGVYSTSYITVTDSEISNNKDVKIGHGGIAGYSVKLTNTTVKNNVIELSSSSYANITPKGGGVYSQTTAEIENCIIDNNKAKTNVEENLGERIENDQLMRDMYVEFYSLGHGGGIYAEGEVTIANSQLNNNYAGGNGGGVYGSNITITNSNFTKNFAEAYVCDPSQYTSYICFDKNGKEIDGGTVFAASGGAIYNRVSDSATNTTHTV